jgi:hypothetical protein
MLIYLIYMIAALRRLPVQFFKIGPLYSALHTRTMVKTNYWFPRYGTRGFVTAAVHQGPFFADTGREAE